MHPYPPNLIVRLSCYLKKHGEGTLVFRNGYFLGLDSEPLKIKYTANHQDDQKDFVLENSDGTKLIVSGEKVSIIRKQGNRKEVVMYWRNVFDLVKGYMERHGSNVMFENGSFIGISPNEPFEQQVFNRIQFETLTSGPFVMINPDDHNEGLKIDGEKVSIIKVSNNQ